MLFVLTLLSLCYAQPGCSPVDPVLARPFPAIPELSSLASTLNETLAGVKAKLGNIPSVSAAFVYGTEAPFFFNLGGDVTEETLYRIASLTKIFTDLAALRADETTMKGVLDRPVSEFYNFSTQDPFSSGVPITPRLLGSHMAGLPDGVPCTNGNGINLQPNGCTEQEILSNARQRFLNLPVGRRPSYSNFGFGVLGRSLFGAGYEAYVKSEILKPLNMPWSGFALDEAVLKRFAPLGGDLNATIEPYTGWSSPAGSMYSSSLEMSRFISFVLNPISGPVSKAAIHSSLQAKFVFPDGNSAMGFPWEMRRYTEGNLSFWSRTKIGNVNGFSSSIEVVPELNFGVVALTNNDGMDAHVLTEPLVRLAAVALKAAIAAHLPPLKEPPSVEGTYENPEHGLILVIDGLDSTGALVVSNFNGAASGVLIPHADNDFIFRAHRQLPMEGTWGIEACDMNWLFSNNDATSPS